MLQPYDFFESAVLLSDPLADDDSSYWNLLPAELREQVVIQMLNDILGDLKEAGSKGQSGITFVVPLSHLVNAFGSDECIKPLRLCELVLSRGTNNAKEDMLAFGAIRVAIGKVPAPLTRWEWKSYRKAVTWHEAFSGFQNEVKSLIRVLEHRELVKDVTFREDMHRLHG